MSGHIRQRPSLSSSPASQILEGSVKQILWQDAEEDGPMIMRLHDGQSVKASQGAQLVSVGEYRRWLGHYTEHPRYGRQFDAETSLAAINGDRRGAIKYLSDLCEGIGPATAKALVDAYGVGSVRILREQPDRYVDQGLLTAATARAASAALVARAATECVTIELYGILAGRGFGGRAVSAAILAWGDRAAEIIGDNPYRMLLARIPGAGWKRVDRLYLDRGGDPGALKRQAMAGWYALCEASTGSTWHPEGLFNLGIFDQVGATTARLIEALALAVRARLVERSPASLGAGLLADPRAASNERGVAFYLARLMRAGVGRVAAATNAEGD